MVTDTNHLHLPPSFSTAHSTYCEVLQGSMIECLILLPITFTVTTTNTTTLTTTTGHNFTVEAPVALL